MSGSKNQAPSREYAGPAFSTCPPASKLPLPPKFMRRSTPVSGAFSSGSDPSSTERKPALVCLTSDAKPDNGTKSATSANEKQEPSSIGTTPKTVTMAFAPRSIAFEELDKRMREDDAERQRLRQRQQAIIDRIEREEYERREEKVDSPKVTARHPPGGKHIRVEEMTPELPCLAAAASSTILEQSTEHALLPALKGLQQDLVGRIDISEHTLPRIDEIEHDRGSLADDGVSLTISSNSSSSSCDEDDEEDSSADDAITQMDIEMDRYESGSADRDSNLTGCGTLFKSLLDVLNEAGSGVDEAGSETDGQTSDTESWVESEDWGYHVAQQEVGEEWEQEDEGYCSMEEY